MSTEQDAKLREAADKLGWWLSAALDDPLVCDSMKQAINEWFDAVGPLLADNNEPPER